MTSIKDLPIKEILKLYGEGRSISYLGKKYNTHAMTISRILVNNRVPLRHDSRRYKTSRGVNVAEGIRWAKLQPGPVSRKALAEHLGLKTIPDSYYKEYPELYRCITPTMSQELQPYANKLFLWLKDNHIPFKPYDRTKLKNGKIDALLLDEYSNIGLQIAVKPYVISKKEFETSIKHKRERAEKAGVILIFLTEEHFKNLKELRLVLHRLKIGEPVDEKLTNPIKTNE